MTLPAAVGGVAGAALARGRGRARPRQTMNAPLAFWNLGGIVVLAGCSRPLDLGSSIVWSTDFETGDFSAWSAAPGTGGPYVADAGASDASVGITSEHAHSGRFAAKFASVASTMNPSPYPIGGGGLYKEGAFPATAYYSAWYYVPEAYETVTGWSIFKFEIPGDVDAGIDTDGLLDIGGSADVDGAAADEAPANGAGPTDLLDLDLQSLPGLGMTLVLVDNRHQYLESALPDPPPAVPVAQWFQIECFYRNVADSSGELTVWLDGRVIYDVHRPMSSNPIVYFTPCSLVNDLSPPSVALYVDDVAVSWVRVTPEGILTVAN